ncbi:DUF2268 domain-containing protein [Oceanobacillus massiliensis]|uniref:DUF2268 domain-containing protein n=1 Tax=Oceanobacillus massiliensis TaxID=1465765 RepID=UPI00028A2DA4|nr:DUF2268 domain-containing protein [Oceanobacillus massiliensis]
MSVIQTDKWLLEHYEDPIKLCEMLEDYFEGSPAEEIYEHLMMHGMYRPDKNGNGTIASLQKKEVWQTVAREIQLLKKLWDGPDIPVFIFPSDTGNQYLIRHFNGKSGLAFDNKLFLFLSPENHDREIIALLTHEYNHVCRMEKYKKEESDYTFLDSIILEGMAENAVAKRCGKELLAEWTAYYTDQELENMWKTYGTRSKKVRINTSKHQKLLYGLRSYPKMLGYCLGYYLVKEYVNNHNLSTRELLPVPSVQFSSGLQG